MIKNDRFSASIYDKSVTSVKLINTLDILADATFENLLKKQYKIHRSINEPFV